MGIHTSLPIYKVAYDLLNVVTELVKNMPRDFKRSIGGKIADECVEIVVLIFRANCARDKAPHLGELIERLQVAELLLRLSKDKRLISTAQYAKAIELTNGVGKQAGGWRKSASSSADFRDRIVHHLLYNRISPRFYASFIADSCACIPGRGTLYAAQRLEAKIRSATQNWSKPVWYLKLDLANFFVSIDKNILRSLIAKRVTEPYWLWLADTVLFHDPRQDYELRGKPHMLALVPAHKRLTNQPEHLGLPIGNLSSQFFANIYLDTLDQFCKHHLQTKHYIRYVDDFLILHDSPQWLNAAKWEIEEFLRDKLHARINPSKTILQPVERGVDFVGQVVRPWHRVTRKRTVNEAMRRVKEVPAVDLHETANSYYGLLRQSTHSFHQRAKLSNILRYRGHSISSNLTKTYRRKEA